MYSVTLCTLYTTLHDIIYNVGGYLLLLLLLVFYFLSQPRIALHARRRNFSLFSEGLNFFFLYTGGDYNTCPAVGTYARAHRAVNYFYFSFLSVDHKNYTTRSCSTFLRLQCLIRYASAASEGANNVFYGRAIFKTWWVEGRMDRKPSKPIYTLRSSAGYLINDKRVGGL